MEMGLGAGLAAMAFWGFIAAVVVAGIWYSIRTNESQQETIRRLIESGENINEETIDHILNADAKNDRVDRDLKIAAYIVLPIAPGIAIFGVILGIQYPEALGPMIGAAFLIGLVGFGLYWAGKVAERWYEEDNKRSTN